MPFRSSLAQVSHGETRGLGPRYDFSAGLVNGLNYYLPHSSEFDQGVVQSKQVEVFR